MRFEETAERDGCAFLPIGERYEHACVAPPFVGSANTRQAPFAQIDKIVAKRAMVRIARVAQRKTGRRAFPRVLVGEDVERISRRAAEVLCGTQVFAGGCEVPCDLAGTCAGIGSLRGDGPSYQSVRANEIGLRDAFGRSDTYQIVGEGKGQTGCARGRSDEAVFDRFPDRVENFIVSPAGRGNQGAQVESFAEYGAEDQGRLCI